MTDTFTREEIPKWLDEAEAPAILEYYELGGSSFNADYFGLDDEYLSRLREFELGELNFEFILSSSGIYLYSLVLHHTHTDTWWRRSVLLNSQDYEWLDGDEDPWDKCWVRVLPEEKTILVFDTVAEA